MSDLEYYPIEKLKESPYIQVDDSQLYNENFIMLYDNFGHELMKIQSIVFREDNKYVYQTMDGEYGILDEYGFVLLNPQKYEISRIKENFILLKEVETSCWGGESVSCR